MRKIILFVIIALFSLPTYATGVGTDDQYDESINDDLELLYSSKITKNLRKAMDSYIKNGTRTTLNDIQEDPLELFKEKFMMLEITQGNLGGYFVTIITPPDKILVLKLWIYPTDKDKYEIRHIKQMQLGNKSKTELENIAKDNPNYWL